MGSIPVGSTKRLIIFSRFFNPDLESKDAYRRPASRTLGRLADAREYQKADTFVSAFAIPYFINALYKNTDSKESSADNE